MSISTFPAPAANGGAAKKTVIDFFTASDTWTPPPGVSYAIATLVGGGGGGGGASFGNTGATSSVSATNLTPDMVRQFGGPGGSQGRNSFTGFFAQKASQANTGGPGSMQMCRNASPGNGQTYSSGIVSLPKSVGFKVEDSSYSVIVGAGGAGSRSDQGSNNGGSGYVSIEYEVEVS